MRLYSFVDLKGGRVVGGAYIHGNFITFYDTQFSLLCPFNLSFLLLDINYDKPFSERTMRTKRRFL
jgi:hypothetical protein